MANKFFTEAIKTALDGDLDISNGTYQVRLYTTAPTSAELGTAAIRLDDLSSSAAAGQSYATDIGITTPTIEFNSGDVKYGDNIETIVITPAAIDESETVINMVVYQANDTDAASIPIVSCDITSTTTNGQNLTITVAGNGFGNVAVNA